MQPQLTIGMAHFDDYDGAFFTIQALRLQYPGAPFEYLVVDQSPATLGGKALAGLLANIGGKYVPMPGPLGTSPSRDRVFREASAPIVLCLDSHVLLVPGAIPALLAFHVAASLRDANSGLGETGPRGPDIVSGPLLTDQLGLYATHFNQQWRAEMWGTWGSAWSCTCNAPLHFTALDLEDDRVHWMSLATPQIPVHQCESCGRELPDLGWAGHESALVKAGWVSLAARGDLPAFEVPGMGLGCFSMRRDDWVGFHPQSQGFGGEELYVHEKVRRAGGRVWCLPALGWIHRFGRPGGVKYPIGREMKVRNYVLEFQELGMDLQPVHEHFVASGLISEAYWQQLLTDPAALHVAASLRDAGPGLGDTGPCGPNQPPAGDHNLDTLFDWCKSLPRDLDQHADKIRELAGQVDRVTAIVKRREWDVFVLAGRPDHYHSYQSERDSLVDTVAQVVQSTEVNPRAVRRVKSFSRTPSDSLAVATIEPTDMLVLDTVHSAERLSVELAGFSPAVSRWILLRGTGVGGEIAEGGGAPGMLPALRQFMREHPEWSVIYHTTTQYGLTLISKAPGDKPQLPGVITMAVNFAKALAEHVVDGAAKASAEIMTQRLEICTLCDQRRDDRCAACGCFTGVKAAWASGECPLGRWAAVDAIGERGASAP